MIVKGGIAANFNYATYDRATGLFVAGNIYDVSSGTAVFVSQVPMIEKSAGVYVGGFIPVAGKSYLVISAVYTDGTYGTVDTSRAPGADQYDAFLTNSALLNFNYAAYDQNAGLTVSAVVYNLTNVTSSNVSMVHVALGVYFGHFQGVVGKSYATVKTPSDTSRAPGSDSFQAFALDVILTNVFTQAVLKSQNFVALVGQPPQISFTQGDTVILSLLAEDGQGNPVDLTDAVFTTYLKGPNGTVVSFPNSQHTANPDQVADTGQFLLSLGASDTESIGQGQHKEILTKIVSGAVTLYYRGQNLIAVYPTVPLQ